jgi:hypothetical protein
MRVKNYAMAAQSKLSKVILVAALMISWSRADAFQLYSTDRRIDPEIKSFKYYVSSTYYDFIADENLPITAIHIAGLKKSLNILKEKSALVGIEFSFEYVGTYDIADAKIDYSGTTSYGDFDFDRKIYFDFTSTELWGRQYVPSASADSRESPSKPGKISGGVVRLNSDFLNYIHPAVNMSRTIIHEVLHILGFDHSTTSSSIMAYTEFWYPTLSADDLIGLQNLYNVGNGSEINISITKSGSPAPGVEVAVIDSTTGVAYTVIADSKGTAQIRHIPSGNYLVAVRELTPTGPCFEDPTRGFLATFLKGSGAVTNDPNEAAVIGIQPGVSQSFDIPVIVGKKRFDCHYATATAYSDEDCNANSFSANTYEEKCWIHMSKTGTRFKPLITNDLVTRNHSTDTDLNSGAHPHIQIAPIGSASGLIFHNTILDADLQNYHRSDFEIETSAADGIHAATCYEGGEFALMTSLIEVQDFGSSATNAHLLPEHAADMEAHRTYINFGTFLRPGDANPGTGPRPINDPATLERGRTGGTVATEATEPAERKKGKKEFWQCGSIGNVSATGTVNATAVALLLFPLAFVRRRRDR